MKPGSDEAADVGLRDELARHRRLLEGVLDVVTDVVVCGDASGTLTSLNRAAMVLLGRGVEPVSVEERAQLYRLYRPDGSPLSPDELPLVRALTEGTVTNVEIAVDSADGERHTLVGEGQRVVGPGDVVLGAVAAFRDVTAERLAQAEPAGNDPLTGLGGRRVLCDHLMRALARADRRRWTTAVFAIDLDRFHRVNDRSGYVVGDAVLVETAKRIRAVVRPSDALARPSTVSRLGGDEFFVLCEDAKGEQAARSIGARLMNAISEPLNVGGQTVRVTASVGVALDRDDSDDADALIIGAEQAMRQAKRRGQGGLVCLSSELSSTVRLIGDTEAALARALEGDQFRLVYQPEVALGTGEIVGVEALLRWDRPQRGVVSPAEFIAVAERNGMIVPIGAWVLDRACRDAAGWNDRFPDRPPLRVSVNVSARQFDDDIVGEVAGALDRARLGPGLLRIEVTESTVMADVDRAVATLEDLRALGVTVSIDDFGTGYSSLASLRRLPLDELKVDKSFVDGLGHDPGATAIVAAIVGMAHALDYHVVAEGIENADQLDALRTLGCEGGQGFLFARPQPLDGLYAMLVDEAKASWSGHRVDAAAGPTADGSYRKPVVVIADDTPTVLQLARLSLTAAGFAVHEATTGREALALAARHDPDCVILDVMMPDTDGFAVCRALRADRAGVGCTIVMLTATASPESKAVAFLAGADDYIVKPFSPRELVGRIRSAMAHRQQATS